QGEDFESPKLDAEYAIGDQLVIAVKGATILALNDSQQAFAKSTFKGSAFNAVMSGQTGHRTAFIQLKRGSFTWWQPLSFTIKPSLSLLPAAKQGKNQLTFTLVNNSNKAIKGTLN